MTFLVDVLYVTVTAYMRWRESFRKTSLEFPLPGGLTRHILSFVGSGVRESDPPRLWPGRPDANEDYQMAKKVEQTAEISVQPLKRASVKLRIIGTTPLFQNRMANKVKTYLLVGGGKKTKAERAGIKPDPLSEFRDSAEIVDGGPTALGLRVVAVKAAMATAALETPGLTKTSAQRLLFMPGDHVPLYGVPQLRMDVVRSADMNKTPDIRSRCYLPKWGAEVTVQFIIPQLSISGVVALLCNAGVLVGVGDFRQEKGKGAFGSFRVIGEGEKDREWDELVAKGGRKAQTAALANPAYADRDTTDLMEFYVGEVRRRAA